MEALMRTIYGTFAIHYKGTDVLKEAEFLASTAGSGFMITEAGPSSVPGLQRLKFKFPDAQDEMLANRFLALAGASCIVRDHEAGRLGYPHPAA
jgi:hypothetical protein